VITVLRVFDTRRHLRTGHAGTGGASLLGLEARLYDGSFEDWSGRDDLPVVNPSAVAKRP